VIASTSPEEEGTFKNEQPYFLSGKNGMYVENLAYSPALASSAIRAAAPLRSAEDELLGVLVARLDVNGLSAVMNRRTNLHETDETYLIDTAGFFVTQPRNVSDPSLLQKKVTAEHVTRCLQQESGVMESVDYRNIPAFLVYRWLPDYQLCLIVKIDQAEAYAPIRAFGGRIAIISVLALLAAAAIAAALARTMTRPILALENGVTRFAKGELDVRLDESSGDELGQLAGEFNKMADALSEQQTHLRRRAEEFFNLTVDLLCTVDSSGRLMDLNPAWEQTLGYKVEELHGQQLINLIHPDDLPITTKAFQQVTKNKAGRFEVRCRHKGGEYRWLSWVVISPQGQTLYAVAHDSTERRTAEEKLRRQTEELERSNRDLEHFAYIASHDMQEPLRLVTSNVQLLARRYQGRLDKDADEFIGFATEAAGRMKNLIGDLLSYSRISAQGKEFAPVALDGIFDQVIDILSPAIVYAGAIVTHDPLPSVMGDNAQITQLFQNLIENAIKFHGIQAPRVHVGVRQLGERWLFFIQDNGIGLEPQYSERVFTLFQRLHNQTQYPGRGVGLAISRKIVERHGGRIWVDSELGKGATFYFTLAPVESWVPEPIPQEVINSRTKDTVVDRATDLI
jgi:PAS domain S-box-containing protein